MSAAALKWIALVLMLVDHIGEFFWRDNTGMVSVARQTVSAVVSVLSGKGTGKDKEPSALSAAALDRVGGHGMQQLCAVAAFPDGTGAGQQQHLFHHGGYRRDGVDF